MKKKVLITIFASPALLLALVVVLNYPKDQLNPRLNVFLYDDPFFAPEMTKEQKQAVYLMLGLEYDKPLLAGKEILESKDRGKKFKHKNKKLFSYNEFKNKNLSENSKYLDRNYYLKNNSSKLLTKILPIANTLESINQNTLNNSLVMLDLLKFRNLYFSLLCKNYSKTRNNLKIEQHYNNLYKNVLDNQTTFIQSMVNLISFIDVHNYIVKNKLAISTSDKKNELLSLNLTQRYKKLSLNELKFLSKRFEKNIAKNHMYFFNESINQYFLFGEYWFERVRTKFTTEVLFDLNELFNIHYSFINENIDNCLNQQDTCDYLRKKVFTLSSPSSKAYAKDSIHHSIKIFNKYNKKLAQLL